ncbi:MAG TPA: hypothetical protein VFJ52_01830, partial [Terriglobia bacterium]|nr:hypothetical protein [Terriglobia bacterium]
SLPGMKAGEVVRGDNFEEELEPLAGGQVLARFANGLPAMVENSFGKGKAILAGTFLPLSYEREHDASTGRLLRSLAQAAGVRAEVKVSGAGTSEVEVRRLVSPQEQLVFVFNHAQKSTQASISVRVPWSIHEARDLVTGRKVTFKIANGDVIFDRNLHGGEIWVVKLSAAG